jgi:hypothetical protein
VPRGGEGPDAIPGVDKVRASVRLGATIMRNSAGRLGRLTVGSVLLVILVLCGGCQTATKPLFVVSGSGWRVEEGQALWRPRRGMPELGGELVRASDGQGRCLIQFAKTPMSLVSAQTTSNRWLIQFPPRGWAFGGRGRGPTRFTWLYLERALTGEELPGQLRFERKEGGGWRLENTGTGESVEGFLGP